MKTTKADYEKIGLVSEAIRCRRLVECEHERVEALEIENKKLSDENEQLRRLVYNYKKIFKIKRIKI